jgi:hypothetical protein
MAKQFLDGFTPPMDQEAPPGWVRFNALVGIDDPDTVVTFGFFDGTKEEMEAQQAQMGYNERRAQAEEYVDQVISNGVFDIVVEMVPRTASTA